MNLYKKFIEINTYNTIQLFNLCIHSASYPHLIITLFIPHIAAPVEGGYVARTREITLNNLLAHPEIGGFILDGFHNNGSSATLLQPANVLNDLVRANVQQMPADKLRIMFGAFAPAMVLQLCALGVDLFDNSYAYLATRHASALTFSLDAADADGKTQSTATYDIDLDDERYKSEFVPLLHGCACLTCTKHTRAYVHHLVKTNELLASILLMM